MRKIVEFIANAIESYKTSMDQYGEARIIISASVINDNNKQVPYMHLVRQK